MPKEAAVKYRSFAEFYPFYLSEHEDQTCRRLHFAGTTIGLACLIIAIITLSAWFILAGLVIGYAFAWAGHFFFEKNRPATFEYPFYSFIGDWVMWKDMIVGKLEL
jgi:hypothetical protein